MGMSRYDPLQLTISTGGIGAPPNAMAPSLGLTSPCPERHLDRFIRFGTAHGRNNRQTCSHAQTDPVVKLLGKRWWIPTGARLEGLKLEPEGPRADAGFPAADQGFSSIQGTLFGFYGI